MSKSYLRNSFPRWASVCAFLALTLATVSLHAATIHYIDFGGLYGFHYNPTAQSIEIGDTVVWRGDFTQYPLNSVSVPSGAQTFGPINTGTSYSYVVTIQGDYSFQDPIYASIGMKGSFTAKILPHGSLTNEGTDFLLGLITPSYNYVDSRGFGVYAIITSYYDNPVRIAYYDASGNERNISLKQIPRRNSIQVPLDLASIRIDTASEVPMYKACHVTSKYPVSIQVISKGANSGGSYLALPTIALGKNYVVASFYDNPGNGAIDQMWLPNTNEAAGGSFLIIATEDGTTVSILPTTTTTGGHTGITSGTGANGIARPFEVGLSKGQCYLVRSNGRDAGDDISGTTIQASKPIAVLSGHEDANLGDIILSTIQLTEGRDFMIEQLLPVEFWDSVGYMSVPFRQAASPGEGGEGDAYRVYEFDPVVAQVHADVSGISGGYPMSTSRYHYSEHFDITTPVDIYSTNGRKIQVMQYDERNQPVNGLATAPSMMTIIPHSRWRKSYNFSLLQAKTIDGISEDQYVNIIADSLADIRVSSDGAPMVPASAAFNAVGSFLNISRQFPVTAAQYRMGPGSYYLHSDYPFIAYTYGMNSFVSGTYYTFDFENAAPAGTQLNTGVAPSFKITIDTLSKCAGWTVCVTDTGANDPGIKSIMLIDDTEGVYYDRPGLRYSNAMLDSTSPAYVAGELHPDYHSSQPYCFKVQFPNRLAASVAPIGIIDNLGNGTFIKLNRTAPTISLSTSPLVAPKPDSIFFPQQKIGEQICTTFVVRNTAPTGGAPILIASSTLKKGDVTYSLSSIQPTIPVVLAPGDSVQIQVCYKAIDSVRHRDTLVVQTDCFDITIALDAHGSTGLISAADLDFGPVTVGDTVCRALLIKNLGSAAFTLTTEFVVSDRADFKVDGSVLPITIPKGGSTSISVCFHPTASQAFNGGIDWATDLDAAFAHSIKSHSTLTGTGKPVAVVKELSDINGFRVYPNPVSGGSVMVGFDELAEPAELSVLDVLGREVYHRSLAAGSMGANIQLSGVPEGTYYVRVSTATSMKTQRFVKVK